MLICMFFENSFSIFNLSLPFGHLAGLGADAFVSRFGQPVAVINYITIYWCLSIRHGHIAVSDQCDFPHQCK